MNAPQGFEMMNGEFINVQPLVAMFNPAMPTKVAHVLATAYMTAAFILASIGAYRIIKGSNHIYHKKALLLTIKVGLVFAIASAIIGGFLRKIFSSLPTRKASRYGVALRNRRRGFSYSIWRLN